MKYSDYVFIAEATRLMEKNSGISLEQLEATIEENLISAGLRKEVIDQLIDIYFKDEKLLKIFKFKAILNPRFLCKKTGKKFYFYIVDARYGRYLPLRAMTRQWEGDLSTYVIYGPQDTIFRLHGTQDESVIISEELRGANYVFEIVEVEDIPYFFRHLIVEPTENDVSESVLNTALNKLVLDYRDAGIPNHLKADLVTKKIVLGVAVIEDMAITNRIKAFVGVTLVGVIPHQFRKNFLDHLFGINLLKQRLCSVYRCKGEPYNYFLEVIVNDPVELDQITDSIAEMLKGHIETSTFVVAKTTERMPMFSREDSLNLRGIVYENYINYVKDVESRFIPHLSSNEISRYSKLLPKERHFLISVMDKLTEFDLDSLEQPEQDVINESAISFAKAFALKDRPKLHSSIDLAYTPIEAICRRAIARLTSVFYMGDFKRAQAEITLPNKDVRKLTLGECNSSFERWNNSSFGQLFKFPEDVISHLSAFISVRNPISHGEIPVSWRENFELMSEAVGEALENGLSSALWVSQNVVERKEWVFPIENALLVVEDIIKTAERTGEKLEEILRRIKQTQELTQQTCDLLSIMFADFKNTKISLLGKIEEIEESQRKSVEQAFKKLITTVEQADTQKLNKVLRTIVDNKYEIIKNSDRTPSSRGKVSWLIEMVKRTVYSLPAETAGNVTAEVIINVSSKYLPLLIGILSSLL